MPRSLEIFIFLLGIITLFPSRVFADTGDADVISSVNTDVEQLQPEGEDDTVARTSFVTKLNEDNFEQYISANPTALVKFYAPWCGHCKKFAPIYERAAETLVHQKSPWKLTHVDCDDPASTSLCDKYGVKGYPTVKIFRHGGIQDYEGPREEPDFVDSILAMEFDESMKLATYNQVRNFINDHTISCVIGFFAYGQPIDEYIEFSNGFNVAHPDTLRFAHVVDPDVAKRFQLGDHDGLVLYHPPAIMHFIDDDDYVSVGVPTRTGKDLRKLEDDWWVYDVTEEPDLNHRRKMLGFVKKYYYPLVNILTMENAPLYEPPILFAMFEQDYSQHPHGTRETRYWHRILVESAVQVAALPEQSDKDKRIRFVAVDPTIHLDIVDAFGVHLSNADVNIVIQGKDERFVMDPEIEISADNIANFVSQFFAQELRPYYRSAKKPRKNNKPVKVVVGKTFNKFVINNKRDVLIMFFDGVDKCGDACIERKAVLTRLATDILSKKDQKKLSIITVDDGLNEVPKVYRSRSGHTGSTLALARHGYKFKEPFIFHGDPLNLEAIEDFVARFATNDLSDSVATNEAYEHIHGTYIQKFLNEKDAEEAQRKFVAEKVLLDKRNHNDGSEDGDTSSSSSSSSKPALSEEAEAALLEDVNDFGAL